MAAGVLSLVIEQNATFEKVVTVYNSDGTAFNLTGYTAAMKIKNGPTTIASLTSGSGITLGGTAGTITVTISSTDTTAMTFTEAEYDLIIKSGAGKVTRLLRGSVLLDRGLSTL